MDEKGEIALEEKICLIERELATLTQKLDEMCGSLKDLEDLKLELKGLKLFLGREHPGFKDQFPGIVRKVVKKA